MVYFTGIASSPSRGSGHRELLVTCIQPCPIKLLLKAGMFFMVLTCAQKTEYLNLIRKLIGVKSGSSARDVRAEASRFRGGFIPSSDPPEEP